jgi:hypothetical protein
MFASHLVGPVAQFAYDDPLAITNHERQVALAQRKTRSNRTQWRRSLPTQHATRARRHARSALAALTSVAISRTT